MRRNYQPAIVFFGGRLFRLSPDQWERLRPQLKGLNDRERAITGFAFLVREGILR